MPPVSADFDASKLETMKMQAVRLPDTPPNGIPAPNPTTNPSMPALPAIRQCSPARCRYWDYEDKSIDISPAQLLDAAISAFANAFGALPEPLYTAEWNFIWLQLAGTLRFCEDERGVYTHILGNVLIVNDFAAEPYRVSAPVPCK
jgi:hypothetical protein